jgi:IS30 family transposase
MLAMFGRIDPHLRRSITFDNDTAFAQHRLLSTMRDMTTGFCDAYASWQKDGAENANGRLRRWLPRHLDIDRTSDQEIQQIVGSRRHVWTAPRGQGSIWRCCNVSGAVMSSAF